MDADSIREGIGYMHYNLNKSDTYAGKADKIKIEYTQGFMAGRTATLRWDIAEDLIKRKRSNNGKTLVPTRHPQLTRPPVR
jgi:hypothetical protein